MKMTYKFRFTLKTFFLITICFSCILFFYPQKRLKSLLKKPIVVISISKKGITLEDGTLCQLAGVQFPKNSYHLNEAVEFIEHLTKQGIEIDRRVYKNSFLFRGVAKYYASGSGNVDMHSVVCPLNEFLVAGGYAKFDPTTPNLSAEKKVLFKLCEMSAKENKIGIWSSTSTYTHFGAIKQSLVTFQRHYYSLGLRGFTKTEKELFCQHIRTWIDTMVFGEYKY